MFAVLTCLRRTQKAGLPVLAGLLIWFAAAGVARAYVMTGEHLLYLVSVAIGKGKSLTVNQQLSSHHQQPDQTDLFFNETLQYLFDQGFRAEVNNDTIHRIVVRTPDAAITVIDGKTVAQDETAYNKFAELLMYRKRVPLIIGLRAAGIDLSTSSIGRLEKQLVFIIGAQYPDESRPQLWVDKETFRPIRWIVSGRSAEAASCELEFRYSNWRRFAELWYPMQVQVWQKGELVRTMAAISAIPDTAIDATLFDVARLREQYGSPPPESEKPADSTGIDDVDKTIEEFKKLLPPQS